MNEKVKREQRVASDLIVYLSKLGNEMFEEQSTEEIVEDYFEGLKTDGLNEIHK